jgi:hypothetical protein
MNTSNLNWDGMADTYEGTFGRLAHPYVGDVLPNGATVIAYYHGAAEGFVLAYVLKGVSKHEYVTWKYALAKDGTDFRDGILCHNGHYFGSLMAAVKDMSRRINGEDVELCETCNQRGSNGGCACREI